MRDLQAKGASSGDGGNRTREPFPPSVPCAADVENPSVAGTSRDQWLYRFFDEDGALLYVGVTECGEERFARHRLRQPWWREVASTTIQTYAARADVLLAERHAIYREKPRYNVVHNTTGRRLYGDEPVPCSEPLTPEAAERRTLNRLRRAFDGDLPARPDNVVYLSDFRRSAA